MLRNHVTFGAATLSILTGGKSSVQAKKTTKRLPHIGKKEQERAKCSYMDHCYPSRFNPATDSIDCASRPSPILCQVSKAQAAKHDASIRRFIGIEQKA